MAALTIGCTNIKSEAANAAPAAQQTAVGHSSSASFLDPELMFQLLAGELAGQFGDITAAVEHYDEAARMSDDPRVAERAVQIDMYAEDDVNGLQAAKRWVELAPARAEARQILGLMLVRNGETEEAMPHFEYLIQHAQESGGNGFMLIGATLTQEKNTEAALAAMQMLVERHPEDAVAHYAYANLALGAGQATQALEAVSKALALKPDMTEAKVLQARASLAAGDKEGAVTGMRRAVEAAPDNDELRIAYAKMLVQVERYGMARAEFAKLLKGRPQNAELLYTLGLLEMQQQRYAEAGEHFRRLLNAGQRTDEAKYYLGRVAEEQEQFDEAAKWYGQVQHGQFYLDAQSRIASVLSKGGELARAREHLGSARSAQSDIEAIVQLYLAEGELLREAKQYQEGMELFNRALSKYPGNTNLLYARALMAEELGRIDQLEADLRAILESDPNNATALNALGFTLADRNERVHEALGYIKRAYEARPDDPAVIDSMGWVQFRLGNYDEAEQHLRRAFKLMPDGEIAGHLSELMWAQGQKKQALSLLREALDKEPEHEYLLELRERYTQ
jgi:tetratricopeptide (TPR) repeat protein